MIIKRVPLATLVADPDNARSHPQKNLDAIKGSLAKFKQVEPLVVNKRTGLVIGGNGRLAAMRDLGWTEADVTEVDLDNTQAAALAIALNRTAETAEWEMEQLGTTLQALREDGFDLADIGFDLDDMADMIGGQSSGEDSIKLADRFGAPPFSILDSRQGYWQERKRAWLSLGIKSEIGRGGGQQVASLKSQERLDAFRQTRKS